MESHTAHIDEFQCYVCGLILNPAAPGGPFSEKGVGRCANCNKIAPIPPYELGFRLKARIRVRPDVKSQISVVCDSTGAGWERF